MKPDIIGVMKNDRSSFLSAHALLAATVICSGPALTQDLPPINVLTFDREFTNWASAQERRFDFPAASVPIQKIIMTIRLDCPEGGCDPWDRSAFVFLKGRNPAGQTEQYEIARFITPYGIGCSWEVDVTDYRIFLAGNVSLGFYIETYIGGDRGWLTTISFDFYPGAPEREVASIENLWRGKPEYGNPDSPIDQFFTAREINIDPAATGVKLRFFVTGHGQGNTDNAAEFARKRHRVHVNADTFEHDLWRDDCDRNPCSPQGGTWQYARAGWCPGSDAPPWDVDISGVVAPGESATIRYEVEAFTNRCRPTANCTSADCIWGDCNYNSGNHTVPIYWIESQLITYRRPTQVNSIFIFQQGLNGYAGTVDTMLLEASPASDRATAPELSVDGDDPGGSGQATQVLIRFDDIVGEELHQIAPDTSIRSARLVLVSTDPGDGAAAYRMRAAWSDRDNWRTFGGDGIQPGLETFPEPDGVADATGGGSVSIDVTSGVAAQVERGCPNLGWALLPTGDNGWDFFSSEGGEPPRLIVETRPLVGDPLIVRGDGWLYFKGTREPPAGWNERGFTPGAGWLTGPTGIGYGDDDDATILNDMRDTYPSVFCRREFTVGPFVTALRLAIDYDDGFAAYVNGVEVARSASLAPPGQPLAWDMLAARGREAGEVEIYDLATSSLEPGPNVLAIQIHNTSLDSSDLSLIPELIADYALIAPGAEWRFLRGSGPLPANWTALDFDDGGWEVGPAGIGYGDDDDVTELLDMQGSYGAVFCRREFSVEASDGGSNVKLRVVYDDGIVIFMNGTEVARLNMPAGPVSADLLALAAIEPKQATVVIPPESLVAGRNVISVSVHNVSLDSSDLSFDPVLFRTEHAGVAGCDTWFTRGDSNTDTSTDIADAVFTLTYLFTDAPSPACEDAADANDDGTLDIADAIAVLSHLFAGAGPLPGPFGECGMDPTVDELECSSFPPCEE